MYGSSLALRRVTQLCDSLDSDDTLQDELERAGCSKHDWTRLVHAVRHGEVDSLISLLDAVEAAAVAAGIDGVTIATRQYRPLPGNSPGLRTISGWCCPHRTRVAASVPEPTRPTRPAARSPTIR